MNISDKSVYPRPNFIRKSILNLNGNWAFDFDDSASYKCSFLKGESLNLKREITVPFPYQSPASGINAAEVHERVVYSRFFDIPDGQPGKTALLHFGAVDHEAAIYVNGRFIGNHCGGYTHFQFDITDYIKESGNEITVFVKDPDSPSQCRGKQIWNGEPSGCHYTAVTGIWQDVWIEFTGSTYITDIRFSCNFDALSETAYITLNRKFCGSITADIRKDGCQFAKITQSINSDKCAVTINFDDYGFKDKKELNWSPNNPNLLDIEFLLETDTETDCVESYFGFRKFEAIGDKLYLNNSQYYLKMVLDQGYWPDGIYRPADNQSFRTDVEKAKELGFNGARKHQKVEDPRYYYWADRLGLIVWGELPSFYSFDEKALGDALSTAKEFIVECRNYPSVVTWVIFNETWGLRKLLGDERQAAFARSLYYLCKSLDPSRLVSTNDGWENLNPTDIITVHDYRTLSEDLIEYYGNISFLKNGSGRTGHPFMLPGEEYKGQPLILSEFGGKKSSSSSGWGYENTGLNGKTFTEAVNEDIIKAEKLKLFSGYCYTQLTDVYQETNGILDMERQEH